MEYTDEQLAKFGYKKLGRLMGSGTYKGDDWKKLCYYHNKAKDEGRY